MESITQKQYDKGIPFFEKYPDYNLCDLPGWVQRRIDEARVFGDSGFMLVFPDGEKYQMNNPLNDLSGAAWLKFTKSVFTTWYPTAGVNSFAHSIRKIHPTPKPPQLMEELIKFFTKEGETVLDYFSGVGGTLLGAALCNRKAIGVELNVDYIEVYKAAAESLKLPIFPVVQGDSLEVLDSEEIIGLSTSNPTVSMILIDPPYADMMSRVKTGGDIAVYGEAATPFTDSLVDLGNMNRDEWLAALSTSIERASRFLKRRGYIVIFVKDIQPKKKEVNLLHADIINSVNENPSIYFKGLKIWADDSVKLFPYGYPFSFVANQVHQYILIFRKEK